MQETVNSKKKDPQGGNWPLKEEIFGSGRLQVDVLHLPIIERGALVSKESMRLVVEILDQDWVEQKCSTQPGYGLLHVWTCANWS